MHQQSARPRGKETLWTEESRCAPLPSRLDPPPSTSPRQRRAAAVACPSRRLRQSRRPQDYPSTIQRALGSLLGGVRPCFSHITIRGTPRRRGVSSAARSPMERAAKEREKAIVTRGSGNARSGRRSPTPRPQILPVAEPATSRRRPSPIPNRSLKTFFSRSVKVPSTSSISSLSIE